MSGLFGGGKKATSHATRAMGIDFQGAQYGPVIPVVYGRNKVPGNCVWYGDFQSHAQQQKAGKGGGGGSTTSYTYSASAQMGLCEGPGIALQAVYDGTSVVDLSSINYAFASGAIGQAPWSHLSGSAALGYSLTALFSFQNLDLGSQASLPNYNYEVNALKQFSGSIPDANPRDILADICSDPYHGVNFPWLGNLTQYSNYCVANSLFLSPVYDQQQSANQALSDLFKYTNAYVYYSEDQLKVVPLGDTAVTGNGVTFTPNVTPVVNLGTDDFIADGAGATITVDRKAPQDNLNLVRVEFKDRANTYHDSAAVAAIDEDIITNGGRSDDSETINGCTTAAVARFVAQNLVQRAFYVRNTYQFKLTWRFCYLEPTDIVTLTDAALGLNLYPVRITEIEEDGDSALTITAEEFPEGIGHSAIYNTQPNGGTNIDQNADPGAVNAPFLFRGPGFLVSNNTPEIWCAVNGSEPMWAGCDVYLSHDGNSYTFAGTVASQARYGALTTALAAGGADPDTTNTPTVEVYAPAELLGGSQTDADNFVTMAMVDSEIIAYETATLTAAETYQLGYLRRGGYGSTNVAHSVGAPFVRLDDSIFRMPVDPSLIGATVWLKFLSINAFGRTPRTLAEETAYQYVVGTNVELPDVPAVPDNFQVQGVADGAAITWTNDNPAATGCTSIEYATASAGPFTALAQVGPTTTAYHHSFVTGATYYYRARARGPLPQSGWSAYTAALSSTGTNVNAISSTANTANSTANAANAAAGQALDKIGNLANSQYLQNPFFTTGDLSGWTSDHGSWAYQSGSNGPASGDSQYAIHIGSSANPTDSLRNVGKVPCYAGAVIKAQCAVNGSGSPNGSCGVRISWRDSTDSEIGFAATTAPCTSNGEIDTFVTATAPSGAVYAHVECAAYSHTTGTYACDNFAAWALVDNLDQVPDGAIAGKVNKSNLDGSGNVDMSSTVIANKNLDFIPNGSIWIAGTQYANGAQVDNANFEASATLPPPGWLSNGAGTLVYTPSGKQHAGNRSASFQSSGNGSRMQSTRTYKCTPGDVWYLQAWMSASSLGACVGQMSFYSAATGFISNGSAFSAPVGATTWQFYAGAVQVPAGADYFKISFGGDTPGSILYVDDIALGQVLQQARLDPLTWAGVRSVLSNSPIAYSISGTTVNFTVAAFTVYGGTQNIAYNASSISVTQAAGTTVTYYLSYVDPTSSGGSQTLYITATVQALAQVVGRVNIGSATVTVAASGGGSSGTGSGGGGFCVCRDMWIDRGTQASDAMLGYPFDCCDFKTSGTATFKRPMLAVEYEVTECVRLTTEHGAVLDCGVTTPFDTIDGRTKRAPQMMDELVLTDDGLEQVVSVEPIGIKPVCFFHFGGISYAAGRDPSHRIYSHNPGTEKP